MARRRPSRSSRRRTTPLLSYRYPLYRCASLYPLLITYCAFSHDDEQKKFQDKLGADWKLDIDWVTIDKLTGESATNAPSKSTRSNLPYAMYDNYIKKFGDEVTKWDADTVEALNESVTDKRFVFTTFDGPAPNGKFVVKVGASVEISIRQEMISYSYDNTSVKTSITAEISKLL